MARNIASPLMQPRLYEVLAERILKEYVEKAKPGDRLPTEAEFAKIYHVSVPTVREALRSLVQSGLLRRRQGSGTYRSERGPGDRQKAGEVIPHVAIVTPMDLAEGNLSCHYNQVIFQTYKHLQAQKVPSAIYFGETPMGSPRQFDDSLLVNEIQQGHVSALVSLGENSDRNHGYFKAAQQAGIACISASEARSTGGMSQVQDFLLKALESLMSHSRRKIACIGFGAHVHFLGERTFEQMVAERGGITDQAWMIGDLHPLNAGSGYSLMREVWTTSRIKPDGLVLCDDVFLNDVALALQELGVKCPEQLMIASLRNEGERVTCPFPFIEVKYKARELAGQLAENVLSVLSGGPVKKMTFDPVVLDPFVEEEATVETAA